MGPTCCAWIIAACPPLLSTSAPARAVGSAASAPTTGWVPGGLGWQESLTRGHRALLTVTGPPPPPCRSAATKGSASASQIGQAKTAVFTTPCRHLRPRGRRRNIRVRLALAEGGSVFSVCHACPCQPSPALLLRSQRHQHHHWLHCWGCPGCSHRPGRHRLGI